MSQKNLFIASRCARTIFFQRTALAMAAMRAGWSVTLIGDVEHDDPFPKKLRSLGCHFAGVPVRQRSANPFRFVMLFIAYFRILRTRRPKVFHAFTVKPIVVGLPAAALAGIPVRIATIAGLGHIFLNSSPVVKLLSLWLIRFSLSFASVVIFYNPDDKRIFRQFKLVREDKAVLILGSGIDTDAFAPLPHRAADGFFNVLFIGRFLREKGLHELLLAAKLLKEAGSNVRICLLGDVDPNNPSSVDPAVIDEAVLQGLVVRLGTTLDVKPHIAAADAVVLPSHREGIALALLEGAAMGKPLIASDVPGCRDIVIDGKTGVLVPMNDVSRLASAIANLAQDPERARAMGSAARQDVVERFSIKTIAAEILAVYESALDPTS